MGSKRQMLQNGLGEIVRREAHSAKRFGDLFTGSGAVAWHVAQCTATEVFANDLQSFASALAGGVVTRTFPFDGAEAFTKWQTRAARLLSGVIDLKECLSSAPKRTWSNPEKAVKHTRLKAQEFDEAKWPLTVAYAGYYFDVHQSAWLDALRATLPRASDTRAVALAALVQAASECAAAPGHTAQPFAPTPTGAPFIREAWDRSLTDRVRRAFMLIASKAATVTGEVRTGDALDAVNSLKSGDLAFVDPPYSAVHYSRFYHVLESVCSGTPGTVTGTGRYPEPALRPSSSYSIPSQSVSAIKTLFEALASRGVRTIVTFPREKTSNGLSGNLVEGIASEYFRIERTEINGRFSTLGGNHQLRSARIPAYELILLLQPR